MKGVYTNKLQTALYACGKRAVEESLSKVIQIPPVLEEGDTSSPQKTSERVARMYVSQLRYSAGVSLRG